MGLRRYLHCAIVDSDSTECCLNCDCVSVTVRVCYSSGVRNKFFLLVNNLNLQKAQVRLLQQKHVALFQIWTSWTWAKTAVNNEIWATKGKMIYKEW